MAKHLLISPGKNTGFQPAYTLVDNDVYDSQKQYRWHLTRYGYVARKGLSARTGKPGVVFLHRVVAETPPNMVTDHISGDKLDNRRSNLRVCTQRQNSYNNTVSRNNTSGYVGVSWSTSNNAWKAYLKHNYRQVVIGYYPDPHQAAIAYNAVAVELRGEFARLNEVPDSVIPIEERARISHRVLSSRHLRTTNTVGYRGVQPNRRGTGWIVQISPNRNRITVQKFDTAEEAAYVYDQFAIQLMGDKAKLNLL